MEESGMKPNFDSSVNILIAVVRLVVTPALLAVVLFLPVTQAQSPKVQLRELPARGSLNFGPTSDLMVSSSDGYYQMWNWREQKPVGPRMLYNILYAKDPNYWALKGELRFSRDGRFMASCRDFTDREVTQRKPMLAQVWDMRTGETLVELQRAIRKSDCKALDFSPDGNTLAVADGSYGDVNAVRFFETRSWTEIRRTELGSEARLLEGLRYSPDGQQIVVWADNRGVPAGVGYKEFDENLKRIGLVPNRFVDLRIEGIVLNAADGQILARRVLHWLPSRSIFQEAGQGFDATGERILSSVPIGSLETTEEANFKNCANYQPPSIPEGFAPTDLCKLHKAVQVWHWRTGQVETLFEFPRYLRTSHHGTDPQSIWTTVFNPQFTADGRYLVWVKEVEEQDDLLRTEISPIPPSITTLEIRDARTYQLLLSRELAPKGKSASGFQVSPDGRYLTWTSRINKRFNMYYEKHFYELIAQ